MNPDTLLQTLQKGFHVTLGATAAVIESIQDPQRRDENLSKLRLDFTQLTEELATKGEQTEREARSFVDTILAQRTNQTSSSGGTTPGTAPSPTAPANVQLDLQELTAQIAALRAELEKLREQDSQSQ